jgi:hypothetical protein
VTSWSGRVLDHLRALNHVQANAAQAEHHHVGTRPHLRGEQHRTHAGGHATADVADLVEGRVLADLGQRDLGHDDVVGEGAGAHVVEQRPAVLAEAAGRIGHQPLTSPTRGPSRLTSSMLRGSFTSQATAARVFMGMSSMGGFALEHGGQCIL